MVAGQDRAQAKERVDGDGDVRLPNTDAMSDRTDTKGMGTYLARIGLLQ